MAALTTMWRDSNQRKSSRRDVRASQGYLDAISRPV
jgi:hypothetical protein